MCSLGYAGLPQYAAPADGDTAYHAVSYTHLDVYKRQAKAQDFGVVSTLQFTQMNRLLSQIAWMCQTGRSQLSPFDNGVQTLSLIHI